MKGVGQKLHPRILRCGNRLSPASPPIATTAGADSVTGPGPQRAQQAASNAGSRCSARILRPDYDTGFMLQPPLEIGLMLHAHEQLRPRSAAGRSAGRYRRGSKACTPYESPPAPPVTRIGTSNSCIITGGPLPTPLSGCRCRGAIERHCRTSVHDGLPREVPDHR
jgi:hypothetical protein